MPTFQPIALGLTMVSVVFLCCHSITTVPRSADTSFPKGQYGYDKSFLQRYSDSLIELKDGSGAALLVSPEFQGRVMTSTAAGDSGKSFGWINYDLLSSRKKKAQFNPVGGEERFWMGPEGGQYSLYFKKGDSFTIRHWQVPPVIDTEGYGIGSRGAREVEFSKVATLTNYAGTVFTVSIDRTIRLLTQGDVEQQLNLSLPSSVRQVAYRSTTQLTNSGSENWQKDKGLMSVWLLGMMTPTPHTKVMIPFEPVSDFRKYITDDYFGKVPADRFAVKDHIAYLRCDGKYRGKVGFSPAIAKGIIGSYDFDHNVLTVISFPVDKNGDYVNSKWEIQQEPYKGDAVNSYNDGPLADGSQLGPFYEIESSSPAKALRRGEHLSYSQVTCHMQGSYEELKKIAARLLGADLDDLKNW